MPLFLTYGPSTKLLTFIVLELTSVILKVKESADAYAVSVSRHSYRKLRYYYSLNSIILFYNIPGELEERHEDLMGELA
jgi:hypothetical protein